jgi:ABC-type transporter Mla subunit MlaD
MKVSTNYFLIGLFVLGGAFLSVVTAVMIGAGSLAARAELVLETYVQESVQGLEVGAHVRFRGVKLGEVTEISLSSVEYETDRAYVLVRFTLRGVHPDATVADLRQDVERMLGEGLRVRLAAQGLTGAYYLDSDLFPAERDRYPPLPHEWTPAHPYVPAIPSTISRLSELLQLVLSNLEQTDIAGLVDEIRGTLRYVRETLDALDVRTLGDRSRTLLGSAEETLGALRADFSRIREDTAQTLSAARSTLAEVDGAIDAEALRRTAARLDELTAAAGPAVEAFTASFRELRDTVRGRARSLDVMFEDLRQVSSSLAELTATLARYPSLLLFGTPPPARGSEGR